MPQGLIAFTGVAPLVGAWIEIKAYISIVGNVPSRSPRGSVD